MELSKDEQKLLNKAKNPGRYERPLRTGGLLTLGIIGLIAYQMYGILTNYNVGSGDRSFIIGFFLLAGICYVWRERNYRTAISLIRKLEGKQS